LGRDGRLFIPSDRGGGWLIESVRQLKAEMLRLSAHFRDQDRYRQAAAKYLVTELSHCTFEKAWLINVDRPVYFRRVGQHRDVLDTAGSLSDGGRFNIGGAQASSRATEQLGAFCGKRSALYLGENAAIVRMEYGDFGMPGSTAITHSVSLKRRAKLNLIDIEAALNSLASQIPDLKAMVGNASMNGKWVDIKYPMPCQILGHWLIANAPKKTEGIRFPTTHAAGGWNVCLFFADTRACKQLLKAAASNSSSVAAL